MGLFCLHKEVWQMVKVTLKGGVVREYEAGTSCADIAKSIGAWLY